jgi:hypothetical protein
VGICREGSVTTLQKMPNNNACKLYNLTPRKR